VVCYTTGDAGNQTSFGAAAQRWAGRFGGIGCFWMTAGIGWIGG
jgi:hypothetical protein